MERVWASRLRWRLTGATQWPAFALFVAGDAVLMHLLPIAALTTRSAHVPAATSDPPAPRLAKRPPVTRIAP